MRRIFSKSQEKLIIKQYLKGISINELSKLFKVSITPIRDILVRNRIKIRSPSDLRIRYNENFFIIPTNELYYFWGFALGDGNISFIKGYKDRKRLCFRLNVKDINILKQFCNWLKIDYNNIHFYKNNKGIVCQLSIYSNYISKDLSKFGLVPRKTYNPVIPNIPKKYIIPFLLGLLDADGHIKMTSKHKEFHLSGNKIITEWAITQFKKIGFEGQFLTYADPISLIANKIAVFKKNDILELANLLNIKDFFPFLLKRKWQNIYDIIVGKIFLKSRNKLSENDVKQIKFLLENSSMKQCEIAMKFNISPMTISSIKNNKYWKHI